MITGFNTDVEHHGVVYHVQTEDKGLETPIILSLVYVGGAILASKRSPYDDLVVAGFDASTLGERLNRQHKLICAAITAGRIEELKRLNGQGDGTRAGRKSARKASPVQPPPILETTGGPTEDTKPPAEMSASTDAPVQTDVSVSSDDEAAAQTPAEAVESGLPSWLETTAESYDTVLEKVSASDAAQAEEPRHFPPSEALVASEVTQPFEEVAPPAEIATPANAETAPVESEAEPGVTELISVEVEGELHVSLMEERDYKAGEIVTLRVRVARGPLDAREAVSGADVTVKILGTEFRPLILTSKTDRDGVAVVHAWLPRFTSGRAAILVRAVHDGFSAEMRRAVRHL